jgi:hypothetical protein
MSYLNQALFGHRIVMDYAFCATCGSGPARKRCTACKMASESRQDSTPDSDFILLGRVPEVRLARASTNLCDDGEAAC